MSGSRQQAAGPFKVDSEYLHNALLWVCGFMATANTTQRGPNRTFRKGSVQQDLQTSPCLGLHVLSGSVDGFS